MQERFVTKAMEDFILYKTFPSGGTVSLMTGLDKTSSDYSDLISIACCFARAGRYVIILSPVHYKDQLYGQVFGKLIGTKYERKCPDLLIDGNYYEYESYERPYETEKIERMISRGAKQAPNIVIDIRESSVTKKVISNKVQRLKGQKSFKSQIASVWIYDGEIVEMVYKNK